jgi:hypothetical protein
MLGGIFSDFSGPSADVTVTRLQLDAKALEALASHFQECADLSNGHVTNTVWNSVRVRY